VVANDLRAGSALVLAGLAAEGHTEISGGHHLDRGYEYLEGKLLALGAKVRRERDGAEEAIC
jgi:UDP-N-acetylglucosamine 1-carboxyvinyltransferase